MDERNERNCPGVCVPSVCVCEPGGGEGKKIKLPLIYRRAESVVAIRSFPCRKKRKKNPKNGGTKKSNQKIRHRKIRYGPVRNYELRCYQLKIKKTKQKRTVLVKRTQKITLEIDEISSVHYKSDTLEKLPQLMIQWTTKHLIGCNSTNVSIKLPFESTLTCSILF